MRWTEDQYQEHLRARGTNEPMPVMPAPKKTVKRRGVMNKLEAKYAEHLEILKLAGEIEDYKYESIRLRLADRDHYTPDFLVMAKWVQCVEVKGSWKAKNQRQARTKLKVAAEMFPCFHFRAVQWVNGQWKYEEF